MEEPHQSSQTEGLRLNKSQVKVKANRHAYHFIRPLREQGVSYDKIAIMLNEEVTTPALVANSEVGKYGTLTNYLIKDAMIALDVVDHFISQGMPIIPIHDSFIVEGQHERELSEVMRDIYKNHTDGFKIRIK